MTRHESYEFDKGPSCKGYGTVYGEGESSYGHDIITITGSYPPETKWARNSASQEDVVVVSGRGGVAIRGLGYQELDATAPAESQKRAVSIAAGQWFRWNSAEGESMEISMLTRPAFSSEQYEVQYADDLDDLDALMDSLDSVEVNGRSE